MNKQLSLINEASKENRLIQGLQRFSNRFEHFNVFSLYSAEGGQKNCPNETIRLFKRMASSLGDKGAYSDDISKILAFLLQGVLGGNK